MSGNDEISAVLLPSFHFLPAPQHEEKQQSSSRPVKRRRATIVTLQCPYCPRTIVGDPSKSIRTNYNRHLLTHTGERPYQCEYCLAKFTTSTNRRRHILRLHKDFVGMLSTPPASVSTRQNTTNGAHGTDEGATADTTGTGSSLQTALFCRFCGASFSCKGSRTLHERHCSLRPQPPQALYSSALLESSAAAAAALGSSTGARGDPVDTFVLCPNCEQELSGRPQLKRHLKYYCPFREDVFSSCDQDDENDNDCGDGVCGEMGTRSRTKRSRRILSKRCLGTARRASKKTLHCGAREVVVFPGVIASADAYIKNFKTVVCPYDNCMSTFFSRTRWLAHVARRHPHELQRDVMGLAEKG